MANVVQKMLLLYFHAPLRQFSRVTRHQHSPAEPIFLARIVNELVHELSGLGDQ